MTTEPPTTSTNGNKYPQTMHNMQSRRGPQMNSTTDTQREETIGEAAAYSARTLHTALLAAGAPGLLALGQHHPDSAAGQEGPHAAWPFVALRVGGRDVHVHCVPTGTGIVLMLRTSDGVMRCLPTWGAAAGAFGAATLAIAREITTHTHG
jgi:hypothetical protein